MPPLPEVQLLYPWALALLLVWLVLPRRRGWPLRLLATALMVLALAQPVVPQPGERLAVLVDVSESVGENALRAVGAFDFSAVASNLDFYYFAGDVTRVAPNTARSDVRFMDLERVDIARALQVARAAGGERLLLVSSGMQSQGDALLALPDVPVDVLPVAMRPNVGLVGLYAPDEVSPGERVEVVAVVDSHQEAELTFMVALNDQAVWTTQRTVAAGRTPIAFSFTAPNESVRLTARIETELEQPAADDTRSVEIAVAAEPRVLVIDDPAMAALLERQGFNVVLGTAAQITYPLVYDAVILREGARAFTPGQLALLESHVRAGGGFMMTGGPDTFGLGDWYRTPIEHILPVHTDLRTDVELPLVATVIVFDRSSSMRAERPSRISLARQGAIEMIDLAHHDDLIGLIAFDSTHEWIFRPRQATQRGKQEMVQAIMRIEPQGGTIVGPAYQEALDALRETDAAIKHVIILTDGEFFDGRSPFGGGGTRPDFEAMARAGLRDGITTTTIGTGEADFDTIERMARAGGGRFYGVTDTRDLPRVFMSEALVVPRSVLRDEGLVPRLFQHALTRDVASAPPQLEAYVASTLKRGAEVLIEGVDREPILAVSRQGLGRTAALTTDLNAWAGAFAAWPELPGLIGTVVRWLVATPQQYSASVSRDGHQLRVVVDAVRDGLYVIDERLEARYGDERIALEQTGPGRYEGVFEATATGGSVSILREEEVVAHSAVNLPPPTFDVRAAETLLATIAERTGGERLYEPGLYAPVAGTRFTGIGFELLIAGLMLFLVELVYRRFVAERRV
jgi:Mg-chelatase subunit ChlD